MKKIYMAVLILLLAACLSTGVEASSSKSLAVFSHQQKLLGILVAETIEQEAERLKVNKGKSTKKHKKHKKRRRYSKQGVSKKKSNSHNGAYAREDDSVHGEQDYHRNKAEHENKNSE